MERRAFLHIPLAAPLAAAERPDPPAYRTVSGYKPVPAQGMPGPYRGRVVDVHCERAIDEASSAVDRNAVEQMLAKAMCELTGEAQPAAAWRKFFVPADVVGIKVNCSGAPRVMSHPEVVAAIARSLVSIGIEPSRIWVYERFEDQLQSVHYERFVPAGVHIEAVEAQRRSLSGYDPNVYVETDFFGEDDTRSNLVRLVSERFTKIINVPNMKDHSASGVTGCLKNIAYGNYSNVARSHRNAKTNTKTFIGTLASAEPLRSRTVLHIMEGLRGVWHAGPFVRDQRFVFFPKRILAGTDPVAMDIVLRETIEAKRKAEGASSVWDRSEASVKRAREFTRDPSANLFFREPGHIEHAAKLGLGVADPAAIVRRSIKL